MGNWVARTPMVNSGLRFSIASFAAWAPGIETTDAWLAWSRGEVSVNGHGEPPVRAMAPILRRRAGSLSKMALEVAYECLGKKANVPMVFCSRHGESARSVDLLSDLANKIPLSPTSFALSVHNATAGLFSMARLDHAASTALAAGRSSVEHAVIEACALLAEGEPEALLVVYDCPLPALYAGFADCCDQPFAWAWLLQPPAAEFCELTWRAEDESGARPRDSLPGGLEILRFHLRGDAALERLCDRRRWIWTRHVQ
jgi:beta-ketoacyl synthase-like protein